ncbi:MAG: hypothetical protein ACK551_05445 [Vampirovibrionales bacterium]
MTTPIEPLRIVNLAQMMRELRHLIKNDDVQYPIFHDEAHAFFGVLPEPAGEVFIAIAQKLLKSIISQKTFTKDEIIKTGMGTIRVLVKKGLLQEDSISYEELSQAYDRAYGYIQIALTQWGKLPEKLKDFPEQPILETPKSWLG